MDINFSQLMAEAGEGFSPVPAGPYTVECEKSEAVKSSTQKPQIRVTLRVLGGAHNGRKLFDQFTLSAGNPAALGFFFDNMAAFGLDRSFFSQLQMEDPMPYVAQMLLGRQCNVAVGIEPYQGVDRNKIKQYRPIAGGQQPANMPMQAGAPGYAPAPTMGAMPVAQPQAPQPQFQPQQPPMPPGFQPQQPQYAQPPQPPQPQYAQPAQEQAPWQQQAAEYTQQLPEQQYQPQPQPQQAYVDPNGPQPVAQQYQQPPAQPVPPQQAYAPVPPGAQQTQPEAAPMWQPSGPPPGYTDPNQQVQQPQQAPPPPPMPQGVPPMPGVPGRGI